MEWRKNILKDGVEATDKLMRHRHFLLTCFIFPSEAQLFTFAYYLLFTSPPLHFLLNSEIFLHSWPEGLHPQLSLFHLHYPSFCPFLSSPPLTNPLSSHMPAHSCVCVAEHSHDNVNIKTNPAPENPDICISFACFPSNRQHLTLTVAGKLA